MPSAFVDVLPQRPAVSIAPERTNIFRPAALVQRAELLMDAITGSLSLCVTAVIMSLLSQGDVLPGSTRHGLAACLLFQCLLILFLNQTGTYRLTGGLLGLRETECVLRAVVYLFAIVIPCALLFSSRKSLLAIFVEAPTLAIMLVLQKQFLHRAHDRLLSLMFPRKRVVIYGSAASARLVFSTLQRSTKSRMRPVAVVTTEESSAHTGEGADPQQNTTGISEEMLRHHRADVVLVTETPHSSEAFKHILHQSSLAGAQVAFRAFGPMQDASTNIDYLDLDGHIVYGLHQVSTQHAQPALSRIIDLVVSAVLLLALTPMLLVTALLVRLDSPGPVFFRQKRIGLHGQAFTIFKFRTMKIEQCGSGVSPSASNDPRITRVGRWLRKTSIDELPQLWNVLRGDMALVGPRPEMPFIVEQYTPTQRARLDALPGVTGVWQLSADRCRPIHENVHYDLYYLRHRSPFFDMAILLHTIFFAMRGV